MPTVNKQNIRNSDERDEALTNHESSSAKEVLDTRPEESFGYGLLLYLNVFLEIVCKEVLKIKMDGCYPSRLFNFKDSRKWGREILVQADSSVALRDNFPKKSFKTVLAAIPKLADSNIVLKRISGKLEARHYLSTSTFKVDRVAHKGIQTIDEVSLDETERLALQAQVVDSVRLMSNFLLYLEREGANLPFEALRNLLGWVAHMSGKSPEFMHEFDRLNAEKKTYESKTFEFPTASLEEVLYAIMEKRPIDGVPIWSKIMEPEFRFLTKDNPTLSITTSNAVAVIVKELQGPSIKAHKLAKEKRIENADDFARRMFDVVENIRLEEKVSTFRATVESLNEKKIPTYRGGDWHLNTFQNLHKRWRKLGLTK